MKKNYVTPKIEVFQLALRHSLMALSENTSNAVEMSSGSFGSREFSSVWDDDDNAY
jgi:hypothetical protein